MAMHTKLDLGVPEGLSIERHYTPSAWDSMKTGLEAALASNPTANAGFLAKYYGDDAQDLSPEELIELGKSERQTKRMDVAEQQKAIEEAGLTGFIKPDEHYTCDMLSDVMEAKKEENLRSATMQKAPGWHVAPGFVGGLVGSFLDPINLATSVVPAVPAAKVAGAIAKAGSLAGRSMVRAGAGAATGALGAALVEPIVYAGQKKMQADYDMYSSLQNIAMGAVFGAAIPAIGGAIGERLNAKRGVANPWEAVEETDVTIALRNQRQAEFEAAFKNAGANMTEEEIKLASQHPAEMFDRWAREQSYSEGISVEDLYRDFTLDIESGEVVSKQENRNSVTTTLFSEINNQQEKVANIVDLTGLELLNSEGKPINIESKKELTNWLREKYQGKTITIEDDGTLQTYTRRGLNDSLKRRTPNHRKLYADLNSVIEKAVFDKDIPADARHERKTSGQKVYYSAIKIDDKYYSVRLKLDTSPDGRVNAAYKDHKIVDIEIEPSHPEGQEHSSNSFCPGEKSPGSISGISFPVLKGDVKPSVIKDNILYQNKKAASFLGADGLVALPEQVNALPPGHRNGGSFVTTREEDFNRLLSSGKTITFASITFDQNDTQAVIRLFKSANASSGIHEMTHYIRRYTEKLAQTPGASMVLRKRYEAQCKFVGANPGDKWTVAQEEQFAKAYEKYLFDGKAPSNALAQSFREISNKMRDIYNEADFQGVTISPQMRKAFNKLNSIPISKAKQNLANAVNSITNYSLPTGQPRKAANQQPAASPAPMQTGAGQPPQGPPNTPASQGQPPQNPNPQGVPVASQANVYAMRFQFAHDQLIKVDPNLARSLANGFTQDRSIAQNRAKRAGLLGHFLYQYIDNQLQLGGMPRADILNAAIRAGISQPDVDEMFALGKKLVTNAQKVSADPAEQQALCQAKAGQWARQNIDEANIGERNITIQYARRAEAVNFVLTNYQGMEEQGIMALQVGSRFTREGARDSVDMQAQGLNCKYSQSALNEIQALGKAAWNMFRKGRLGRDLANALFSIDNPKAPPYAGPKEAMDIAKIVHAWSEEARLDANEAGAFIGKMPGFIVSQSHDQLKMHNAGRENWKGFIRDKLDWTRTAKGIFDPQTDARGISDYLDMIYDNLLTGHHPKKKISASAKVGGRNADLAEDISHHRVLHFKSGEDWYDYNQAFGRGSMENAIIHGFANTAKATAVMRVFGPEPAKTLQAILGDINQHLTQKNDQQGLARMAAKEGAFRQQMAIIDPMSATYGNPKMAGIGSMIRAWQSLRLLGRATISGLSDIPVIANQFAYHGRGFFKPLMQTLAGMLKGRKSEEQRRILSTLGVLYDSMSASLAQRFGELDGPGKMSSLLNTFFKLNGLTWWTETHKSSAALMFSHYLAHDARLSWAKLNPAEQRALSLCNIKEPEWEMLRKGNMQAADGREYFTPDIAQTINDAEMENYCRTTGRPWSKEYGQSIRDEIEANLQSYFRDNLTSAVLEPDARTRAILTQGNPAGTVVGELLRSATQFKSFSAVFIQRVLAKEIYGRGADTLKGGLAQMFVKSKWGDRSHLAEMIVATTIFGYCAMVCKDMLSGKKPRDPEDRATWLAAFLQGGGAGIIGDFFLGEASRFGDDLATTLAGPTVGSISQARKIWQAALEGKDVKSTAFRTFYTSIPGNNIFWLSPAMNYLVTNSIYEHLNPGYLRRMQRRVRKETNQTFMWKPKALW